MGKLRHLAIVVEDIEKTATFYEQAFGMKRVRNLEGVFMLSDGVVSMAVISSERRPGHKGLHHFGFVTPDLEHEVEQAEAAGAVYEGKAGPRPTHEQKFLDPNGLAFDISSADHARKTWCVSTD